MLKLREGGICVVNLASLQISQVPYDTRSTFKMLKHKTSISAIRQYDQIKHPDSPKSSPSFMDDKLES